MQLHMTLDDVRAAAERAASDKQPVLPEALQARLRLLLADVSPATLVMRFFACATGKQSPQDAVVADFQHAATGGVPGDVVTALAMEAGLRKALAEAEAAGTSAMGATASAGQTVRDRGAVVQPGSAPLPQAHLLLIDAERASFGAMDLDSDGALSVQEYMGGFVGFERALHSLMVAVDADPRDQRISERELRAVKREDVVQALLGFAEHIPQEQRTVEQRRAEL